MIRTPFHSSISCSPDVNIPLQSAWRDRADGGARRQHCRAALQHNNQAVPRFTGTLQSLSTRILLDGQQGYGSPGQSLIGLLPRDTGRGHGRGGSALWQPPADFSPGHQNEAQLAQLCSPEVVEQLQAEVVGRFFGTQRCPATWRRSH